MQPSLPIRALIIGDEILSGRRQDKHLTELIAMLGKRRLSLSEAWYVGDDPARIEGLIYQATQSPGLLFSFGGIGATPDDHTRACAARALGKDLMLHNEGAELIRERMREMAQQRGEEYDPLDPTEVHRLNMAVFPQGSELIPNSYNRIPGFRYRTQNNAHLYFVPGFPVMAWPMVEWVLDTLHPDLAGSAQFEERSVIVMRAMESHLTPLMIEIERIYPDIKVFSLPSVDHPVYGRHIDLGVKGCDSSVAKAYDHMLKGLRLLGVELGPESVRKSGA